MRKDCPAILFSLCVAAVIGGGAARSEQIIVGPTGTATAVAADGGSFYVTGYSTSPSQFVTIKYDLEGNEVWARTAEGTQANGIAVDPTGNIYVTGVAPQPSFSIFTQAQTIKYDPDGNVIWNMIYATGSYNEGAGITLDSAGNIHVAGKTSVEMLHTKYNYLSLKYDPLGTLLGEKVFDGGSRYDYAYGAAADVAGNIYVTGCQNGLAVTVAYDPAGVFRWAVPYRDAAESCFKGIAVDPGGTIHTAGYAGDGTTRRLLLARYAANGTRLQSIIGPDGSEATGIAVDNGGNAYLTGFMSNGLDLDYLTARYDAAGNLRWTLSYDRGSNDTASGIAVNAAGNTVTVAGASATGTGNDFLTIRYQPPRITTTAFPTATAGTFYSQTLAAAGGAPPYSWALASGNLPDGLTLNSATGEISGIPTTLGAYENFSAQVTDASAQTDTGPFTLATYSFLPPVADFTADPVTGQAPLFVNFTDTSAYSPANWSWTFGDSGTATSRNPLHVYTTPGTYTVALTSANPAGADTKTSPDFITVLACPSQPVRIGALEFSSLQAAYDTALTGDIILAQALQFGGDLVMAQDIQVTLKGGFECGYGSNPGTTGLGGKLQVRNGTVSMEKLRFR